MPLVLTPDEADAVMEWQLRRRAQLVDPPRGFRRRTDLRYRRSLKEWRVLRGLSLTALAAKVSPRWYTPVSIDTLRALEDGTATAHQRKRWLTVVIAALGVPRASVNLPPVYNRSR